METLERVETRHKEILKSFDQVISVLAPVRFTSRRNETVFIDPENINKVANMSEFLSSKYCTVSVIKENPDAPDYPTETDKCEPDKLIIFEGENYSYSLAPAQLLRFKPSLEKAFKEVEAFTKKVIKERVLTAEMSIKTPSVLIKDSKKVPNDTKKVYICALSEDKKESKPVRNEVINQNPDELKTVNFQIEGKYIDQIYKGEKVEDYRSISQHNAKLLCDHIKKEDLKPGEQYVTHNKEIWRLKKDLTHVRFFNGYKSDRKELLIELKAIELNKFVKNIPEGMKPGTICFTLIFGQSVVSKNFES